MLVDPIELGALEKAVNDAAAKASALWITFITFQLYLSIAFGSVTYRDLFLGTSVRLPLISADLPVIGLFTIGPFLLAAFHFYVVLQLHNVYSVSLRYNDVLSRQFFGNADRELLRHRLDTFPFVQLICGPRERTSGMVGASHRLIIWTTMAAAPLIVLVQAQVVFLPYHSEWSSWAQRLIIVADLLIVWQFSLAIPRPPKSRLPRVTFLMFKIISVLTITAFSFCIATFPGEVADWLFPPIQIPGSITIFRHHFSSLRQVFVAGNIRSTTSQPVSVFSNRLVLVGDVLIDRDKIDKVTVSVFARDRDFRQAIFDRSDLRKVDFSGSKLSGAWFQSARLEQAHLGCSNPSAAQYSTEGCTELDGAHFDGAAMQGAVLDGAQALGTDFTRAELQGASLSGANFLAADFQKAKLIAADLSKSSFVAVSFEGADLRGADLSGSDLSGANLDGVDLSVGRAKFVNLWRAQANTFRTYLADFDKPNFDKPWRNKKDFDDRSFDALMPSTQRRARALTDFLDPVTEAPRPWPSAALLNPMRLDELIKKNKPPTSLLRAEFLTQLACEPEGAPFVARSLLRRDNIGEDLGSYISEFVRILKGGRAEPFSCLGTHSFDNKDWGMLQTLINRSPPN